MVRGISAGQEGDTTSNLSPDRKRSEGGGVNQNGAAGEGSAGDDNGRRKLSTWGAQKKREGGTEDENFEDPQVLL